MNKIKLTKLDIPEIKNFQCNRHPLLFLDKVIEVTPGKSAIGKKNFSYNEWFFPPHFEDDPNVPGFIQVETLVQTFIMTFLTLDDFKGMKTNFISIDNVKFKRKIIPGDTLIIKSELNSFKRGIAKGSSSGYINDDIACSADFIVSLPDVLNSFKPKN